MFLFILLLTLSKKYQLVIYRNYDIIMIGDDKYEKYKTISRTKK